MHNDISLSLVLVLLLSVRVTASLIEDELDQCEHIVKNWASSTLETEVKEDKHVLRDLLFFLHIPRTGGRTYYHCFLKKLYPTSSECPRSYDKLRFNPRKSDCSLLVTHDDYSMMSKLPKEKTSVLTILRDPVDRVFSAYEFSVEVGARFLLHPNITSAIRMTNRLRAKGKAISTLDIWPWKYLVPWMREDLFTRRDARKQKAAAPTDSGDPYNIEDIVMPLRDYITHPIARDIIHNGATFQIAGLTNNSYLAESHEVRHCVMKHEALGEYVLEVAKKRLDDMLYIGLTEKHKESAKIFADVVGAQVISQFKGSNLSTDEVVPYVAEESSSDQHLDGANHGLGRQQRRRKLSIKNAAATKGNLTAGELIELYETCVKPLRKSQAQRRINSLKQIRPVNFTKEARHHIPEEVLQEIISLNHLDVELYKYAQDIFTKQKRHMVPIIVKADAKSVLNNPYYDGNISSRVFYISLASFSLVLFVFLFVNARRRTFKLKL